MEDPRKWLPRPRLILVLVLLFSWFAFWEFVELVDMRRGWLSLLGVIFIPWNLALAYGLWMLKPWGRILLLINGYLILALAGWVLLSVRYIAKLHPLLVTGITYRMLVILVITGLLVAYFHGEKMRRLFAGTLPWWEVR